jgi:hypothetical protein
MGKDPESRFMRKNPLHLSTEEAKTAVPPSLFPPDQEMSPMDDFYYSPSTMQIPEFDVPEFLPNLPG